MNTTKELLKNQTNHLNELLKQIGVDMGLTVSYGNGKPSLTAYKESRTISIALSKPELQSTISGITNILNEINRVQREQKRNTETDIHVSEKIKETYDFYPYSVGK